MLSFINKIFKLKPKVNIEGNKNNVLEKQPVVNVYADGWIEIPLMELLKSDNIDKVIEQLKQTESSWLPLIPQDWFTHIKFINRSELLKYSTVLRNHVTNDYSKIKLDNNSKTSTCLDDNTILNSKRMITISSIIFGFKIPKYFIVLDNYTLLGVLKYLIVTEEYLLDINNILPDPNVPIIKLKNLTNTVTDIVENIIFNNVINSLDDVGRLPNFIHLKQLLLLDREKTFSNLNDLQLKKALTCIFLLNQISIPRDYLFLDIEVIDWVNKTGRFEIVKNYTKKNFKEVK